MGEVTQVGHRSASISTSAFLAALYQGVLDREPDEAGRNQYLRSIARGSALDGSPAGTASGSVVGIAPTPTGNGYWILGNDGSVYNFGGATHLGGLGGIPLNRPIVGLAM